MAIFRMVRSAVPFIFSTLAFAFVITAFVSRDWARQNYYSPELSPSDWKTPLYTLYRSASTALQRLNKSKSNSSRIGAHTSFALSILQIRQPTLPRIPSAVYATNHTASARRAVNWQAMEATMDRQWSAINVYANRSTFQGT